MQEEMVFQILEVVNEIPEGKVATYGQIARLIGREKNARLVGKVLSHASYYGKYPCHRVVNHMGRLAPGFDDQKDLLLMEGVSFKNEDCVDLAQYQWMV
ncbi:MAG: MGMT family protein [Bacillota bacterium]|nr:MGMT family protein [Bacillota bacterium]